MSSVTQPQHPLNARLRDAISQAVECTLLLHNEPLSERAAAGRGLVTAVLACLLDGLRRPGPSGLWSYLGAVPWPVGPLRTAFNDAGASVAASSDAARAEDWVRRVLNTHLLRRAVVVMSDPRSRAALVVAYTDGALIRNSDATERLELLCAATEGLPLAYHVDDPLLSPPHETDARGNDAAAGLAQMMARSATLHSTAAAVIGSSSSSDGAPAAAAAGESPAPPSSQPQPAAPAVGRPRIGTAAALASLPSFLLHSAAAAGLGVAAAAATLWSPVGGAGGAHASPLHRRRGGAPVSALLGAPLAALAANPLAAVHAMLDPRLSVPELLHAGVRALHAAVDELVAMGGGSGSCASQWPQCSGTGDVEGDVGALIAAWDETGAFEHPAVLPEAEASTTGAHPPPPQDVHGIGAQIVDDGRAAATASRMAHIADRVAAGIASADGTLHTAGPASSDALPSVSSPVAAPLAEGHVARAMAAQPASAAPGATAQARVDSYPAALTQPTSTAAVEADDTGDAMLQQRRQRCVAWLRTLDALMRAILTLLPEPPVPSSAWDVIMAAADLPDELQEDGGVGVDAAATGDSGSAAASASDGDSSAAMRVSPRAVALRAIVRRLPVEHRAALAVVVPAYALVVGVAPLLLVQQQQQQQLLAVAAHLAPALLRPPSATPVAQRCAAAAAAVLSTPFNRGAGARGGVSPAAALAGRGAALLRAADEVSAASAPPAPADSDRLVRVVACMLAHWRTVLQDVLEERAAWEAALGARIRRLAATHAALAAPPRPRSARGHAALLERLWAALAPAVAVCTHADLAAGCDDWGAASDAASGGGRTGNAPPPSPLWRAVGFTAAGPQRDAASSRSGMLGLLTLDTLARIAPGRVGAIVARMHGREWSADVGGVATSVQAVAATLAHRAAHGERVHVVPRDVHHRGDEHARASPSLDRVPTFYPFAYAALVVSRKLAMALSLAGPDDVPSTPATAHTATTTVVTAMVGLGLGMPPLTLPSAAAVGVMPTPRAAGDGAQALASQPPTPRTAVNGTTTTPEELLPQPPRTSGDEVVSSHSAMQAAATQPTSIAIGTSGADGEAALTPNVVVDAPAMDNARVATQVGSDDGSLEQHATAADESEEDELRPASPPPPSGAAIASPAVAAAQAAARSAALNGVPAAAFAPLLVAAACPDLWTLVSTDPPLAPTAAPTARPSQGRGPGFRLVDVSPAFLSLAALAVLIVDARWVEATTNAAAAAAAAATSAADGAADLPRVATLVDAAVRDVVRLCLPYCAAAARSLYSSGADETLTAAPGAGCVDIDVALGEWRRATGVGWFPADGTSSHGVPRRSRAATISIVGVDGSDSRPSSARDPALGRAATVGDEHSRHPHRGPAPSASAAAVARGGGAALSSASLRAAFALGALTAPRVRRLALGEPHSESTAATGGSSILCARAAALLEAALPPAAAGRQWALLYSLRRDGAALATLLARVREHDGPTLLVIRDARGGVFGGFAAAPWSSGGGGRYFGSGGSFVFTMEPRYTFDAWRDGELQRLESGADAAPADEGDAAAEAAAVAAASADAPARNEGGRGHNSIDDAPAAAVPVAGDGVPQQAPAGSTDAAALTSDGGTPSLLQSGNDSDDGFSVYRWTRQNRYFQLAQPGVGIGMGGGGAFAFYLDDDLDSGSSGRSATFLSPPLCRLPRDVSGGELSTAAARFAAVEAEVVGFFLV